MGGRQSRFTHKVVESMGNEDPAPEALRSHASVQIKMRIQENAKKIKNKN
jgi:hypothetical protein